MTLTARRPDRRTWLVASALIVALLLPLPATSLTATARPAARAVVGPGLRLSGAEPARVIVTGTNAARRVQRLGGQVIATLPIVDGVAAELAANRLRALASQPGVRAITADRVAQFEGYAYDTTTTASNFARSTEATDLWAQGDLGQGVGVAILDTGVSPMPDFDGRLVHGPDLSGEATTIDSYGHGTVMAGLAAGSGSDSSTRGKGAYTGVAPGAHVVAVKVAGRNGAVDVSTILQAMSWVAAYRDQFNIRVLNLSWGVPSTQDPAIDPLDYAVERLWSAGIVVVVAAGNGGPDAGTITKPADDPVVLTVSAYNEHGDSNPGNDTVPQWSSHGPTATGLAKPDLVAPGRSLVATRSYGSYVEQNNSRALIDPSYIRGSGTSEAAAVTSGAVALLVEAHPDWTPDQIKDALTSTASPIAYVSASAQGAGRLQLDNALAASPRDDAQPVNATGLGSLEASRGPNHVVADCSGESTEISGEIDARCQPWDPQAWTRTPWDGDAWTGVSWKGAEWDGVSWKDVEWSDATWDGVSWKGGTWTGVSWKDELWTGVSWKDSSWTSDSWTSTSYDADVFLNAFWGVAPGCRRPLLGEGTDPGDADLLCGHRHRR